jgi:hypothetical protein
MRMHLAREGPSVVPVQQPRTLFPSKRRLNNQMIRGVHGELRVRQISRVS